MSTSSPGKSTEQAINDSNMYLPFVRSRPSDSAVDETNLPVGVQLTGGQKLRDAGLKGKGIRVAVIDSGVDAAHPAFNGRVKKQTWWFTGTLDGYPNDHGTHVAGTIHFMAPDAEIYDYRVFGQRANLSGDKMPRQQLWRLLRGMDPDTAIALSIYEAVRDGCHVINMSLGGPIANFSVFKAVQYAHSQGVHVVCAAGNEGDDNVLTNDISYPAFYDEAINVAAVAKKDGLPVADFSNSNPQVDYAGIGVMVSSMKPGGGFQESDGTSMAAPHVTGLIAALLTNEKFANDKELRKMLTQKYAKDLDGIKGPDNSTGDGFLTFLDKKELDEMFAKL